jgi:hypothetical protein
MRFIVAALFVACLITLSCASRSTPAPKSIDGVAYGAISVPFRHRWWHYYERGVSWENGRFWLEAESDFRHCLAMRATDSRRARIYGLHFVQCFAHRELGAVLIERGDLDGAEKELRASMAQEPSAKAEFLLKRIAQLRDKQAGALETPVDVPVLALDGPGDDQIVTSKRVLYKYRAQAAKELQALRITDGQGKPLMETPLTGENAGGMVALTLEPGAQVVRFTVVTAAGHSSTLERRLEVRREPAQGANLRAVALVLPVQAPEVSLRADDDPKLLSALFEDGRFRLLDRQADDILNRELKLVDAGLVNRKTAARAGRRLNARYVIAGTVGRGKRDMECFVRLVQSATGNVLATADAYAEIDGGGDEDVFFTAVAERLRQVFPVLQGTITSTDERIYIDLGKRCTMPAHMRFHVFGVAEADDADQRVALNHERDIVATVEIERSERERSEVSITSGNLPGSRLSAVSE